MTYKLAIIEIHEEFTQSGVATETRQMRFKLIETYHTSDGMRSRLCDGLWATKEQAKMAMQRRLGAIKG